MASLVETRNALEGLVINDLINVIVNFIPHIELNFYSCLAGFLGNHCCSRLRFVHQGDFVHVYDLWGYCIYRHLFYEKGKPKFQPFTIDFNQSPCPILSSQVYSVEFDPIEKTIVSLIHRK